MSSSKSNMNTAGRSNGGAPRALPAGVALPLQPKGTTKAEVPRAIASSSKVNTQQPSVFGNVNNLTDATRSMQLNGQATKFQPSQPQNPYMKSLLRDSEPDKAPTPVVYDKPLIVHGDVAGKGKAPAAKETSPIGTRPQGALFVNTIFTTDVGQAFQGGHFIRIRNIKDIHEWHNGVNHFRDDWNIEIDPRLYDIKVSYPNDRRTSLSIYLCVDDIKQAGVIVEQLPVCMSQWQVEHVSFSAYAAAPGKGANTAKPPLHYDGQVHIVAQPDDPELDLADDSTNILEKGIYELAQEYGYVHAFTKIIVGDSSYLHFRVEFNSIRSAHHLINEVNTMNPHPVGDWLTIAFPYTERSSQDSDDDDDTTITSTSESNSAPNGITTSPTGRTAWSTGADGRYIMQKPPVIAPKFNSNRQAPQPMPPFPPMQMPMPMQLYNAAHPLSQDARFFQEQNPMAGHGPFMGGQGHGGQVVVYDREVRGSRSHGWGTGPLNRVHGSRRDNHNMDPNEPQSINLERLALGHDVRTTIMLRNIPNQWNYRDLKARLDQICAGKYDFTYLRIDFEKATNVGYGFINLTHPDHVVPFVKAIVGAEWAPGMYPRKIGQISYATIQGIDCLTEKFRNSAIMSEFPDYRPKLWYTAADAPSQHLIGTEKPFPAPNNHTKTQRSHDNAGTIGLYAPRSSLRGGDRSRRSNYDRGTQHQLEEDAYYAGPSYGYDNYTAAARGPIAPPPGAFYPPAGYAMPYYPPPTQYYGYPAFGHPGYQVPHPQQWVTPYNNVPASRLRTISQGRLAGRPQNVTVAQSHIPRSFGQQATTSGGAPGSSAATNQTEMEN
ncbi:Putative mei2-like RNA recognition, RNA-binding domain superfamily [Septoria linicola]|uniref:Mei2-like RNA recognition, RNA-binding domain superfamily n=1 Tax=Septoria linicola TaxID=215465 RepID=A0A9Q9ASE8_9PEZI|nr:putative mei2-like RNA recognition, RNA-binding domain superfamily [Septoria linicola]USW51283.1 Putative mei2-like RNA recognition, RNA-binding domain superfamily [Septoria linicola]